MTSSSYIQRKTPSGGLETHTDRIPRVGPTLDIARNPIEVQIVEWAKDRGIACTLVTDIPDTLECSHSWVGAVSYTDAAEKLGVPGDLEKLLEELEEVLDLIPNTLWESLYITWPMWEINSQGVYTIKARAKLCGKDRALTEMQYMRERLRGMGFSLIRIGEPLGDVIDIADSLGVLGKEGRNLDGTTVQLFGQSFGVPLNEETTPTSLVAHGLLMDTIMREVSSCRDKLAEQKVWEYVLTIHMTLPVVASTVRDSGRRHFLKSVARIGVIWMP